ncbi:MAG TPA: hypothetical protein VM658_14530 [bacterium]|nr:hypothetical protein [bacterium]
MAKANETRIVIMNNDLMKLYDMHTAIRGDDIEPITFYDPQECLEMMVEVDEEDLNLNTEKKSGSKAERLAKQWGELELRLSFFAGAYKWQ